MGDMADYYDEREEAEATERGLSYTRRPRRTWPNTTATKKGSAVATKKLTPKQQLRIKEAELDGNLTLQQTLKTEEQALRADIRRYDIPAEPPAQHTMFRVAVRFSTQGLNYTYLLTRTGSRWFTTGTKDEQKKFDSWAELCEWLNGTSWHSRLDVLGVDIEHAYPTSHDDEVQF